MKKLGFALGSTLVALAFSAWCYWAFFRDAKTYHLDALSARAIRYGTPQGEIQISIPASVASRDDFVRFCEPLLRHSDPWKRVVAAEYLARTIKESDRQYPSVQRRIWELCSTTEAKGQLRILTGSFWFVVDDTHTGRIISRLARESDRHVRAVLLSCLGRIRSEESMEFLAEVALTSGDPDDAYAAARNISLGSSPGAIRTVAKYLARNDAKRETMGGPSMPVRLQSMKKRFWYRWASLVAGLLFPALVCLIHAAVKAERMPVTGTGVLAVVEAVLLLGYLACRRHYVLTALGGGDVGAFNASFQATMNCAFLCLLFGLYIVNAVCCREYWICVHALRLRSPGSQPAKASFLLSVFFLNLALILAYMRPLVCYT